MTVTLGVNKLRDCRPRSGDLGRRTMCSGALGLGIDSDLALVCQHHRGDVAQAKQFNVLHFFIAQALGVMVEISCGWLS